MEKTLLATIPDLTPAQAESRAKACLDDSCDGGHCSVCGSHFFDWYSCEGICDSCFELKPFDRQQVGYFVRRQLALAFPGETMLP